MTIIKGRGSILECVEREREGGGKEIFNRERKT